ncbi:hypothetical protein VK792_03710 [Mesobacterium sp. TK19101]|uniref:Uncharacterized protein n=1 Tax=Mesobacterium hydrothermale TaxID=3111907 RepID=A0ABU6HFC0_9RHOB|nr:hypothetical protein [Mesobacterium sp. TK19101]MEC3860379.1 hypothetical protein [Mesobacterium sp. TK19101]
MKGKATMNDTLKSRLDALEAIFPDADFETRAKLVGEVETLVARMEAEGLPISEADKARLHDLVEDEVESGFDNMPV